MINQKFKHFLLIWVITFVCINSIYLIIGLNSSLITGAFWINLITTDIIQTAYILVAKRIFDFDKLESFYYRLPQIRTIYICLLLNIIANIIPFVLNNFKPWMSLIIEVFLLLISSNYVIRNDAEAEIIENIDKKIIEKTKINEIANRLKGVSKKTYDEKTKTNIKKLYEKIRYLNNGKNDLNVLNEINNEIDYVEMNLSNSDSVEISTKKIEELISKL